MTLLSFAFAATPGYADPPKPGTTVDTAAITPAEREIQDTQAKLDIAYDRMQERGTTRDADAFTSIVLDPVADTLTVHRIGGTTDLYDDLVPAGTKLAFSSSQVTLATHETLTAALSKALPAVRAAGTVLNTWGLLAGDDGPFQAYYTGAKPTADVLGLLPAGIDLVAHEPRYRQSSRFADTNPFYGGSFMQAPTQDPVHPGGEKCTSGFGVRSNINNAFYLTTSWHCYDPRDTRMWTGTTANYVGPVTAVAAQYDVAFIKASDASHQTSNNIFTGGYNADTTQKEVVGVSAPRGGDLTCTSGSFMRAVCNVRISSAISVSVPENNAYTGASQTVTAYPFEQINHTAAVSDGDSGGPVFSNTNGNTQAIARGFITAQDINTQANCPSYNQGFCTYAGAFTSAASIVANNNVAFVF